MTAYLGAHCSVSDGMTIRAEEVHKAGGNIIQLFVSNIRKRKISDKKKSEFDKFNKYISDHKMKCIVHASYTINLASEWDKYTWWVRQFMLEIENAHKLNAIGVVVHLGKQLKLSSEEAYNNMFSVLLYVHEHTKAYRDVKIIIETSSGQGSEMCYKLEDLAYFFTKLKNTKAIDRFRVCIDTCHIFAAGYDIRNVDKVKTYLDAFDQLIGVKYVCAVHLNDSYNELGSRIDRHANLGKGHIGVDGLEEVYKYFTKLNVPIILETPNLGFVLEIPLLKSL